MTQSAQTPAETITNIVATFLTAMFLTGSGGNPDFARAAALETINSYRARTSADLFVIGQLIAFGLAALGSLSLSMTDDISLPMLLRLRASACACHRASDRSRRTLQQDLAAPPPPPAPDPIKEAEIVAQAAHAAELARKAQASLHKQPAPAPQPQPQPQPGNPPAQANFDEINRSVWATAFATVAQEYAAEMPNLPPAQRWEASMKSQALSTSAHALLAGVDLEPFRLSTNKASERPLPSFPAPDHETR